MKRKNKAFGIESLEARELKTASLTTEVPEDTAETSTTTVFVCYGPEHEGASNDDEWENGYCLWLEVKTNGGDSQTETIESPLAHDLVLASDDLYSVDDDDEKTLFFRFPG